MPRIDRTQREQGLAELLAMQFAELGLAQSRPRVLDIGCADLRAYSRHARDLAAEYIGLDLDLGELRAARDDAGDPPALVNAGAERLPFPDARFDVVICNDMLAYTDKARVFGEIERVLVPGGHVLCLYNNSIGWSLYKLRYPEKPVLVEWAHSTLVIVSTLIRRATGWRLFHTSFNTLSELAGCGNSAGLETVRAWRSEIGFAKLNLVFRKPLDAREGLRPTALITGGYVSQNMGSAAMSIVTARHLAAAGFKVRLLAKYPHDDKPLAKRYDVPLQAAPQLRTTLLVLPLLASSALLDRLFPAILPAIRRRWFGDARLCFDIGGITFSRERGLVGLLINATWLLLPILLRIPVVKGSQAIGPFGQGPLWRPVPALLRRVRRLYSRGATTQAFLAAADIPNIPAADIAFLLEAEVWELPAALAKRPFIAILPSSVVKRRYDRIHGEGAYVALLAEIVDRFACPERPVALIAHSYRAGETLNSNDLPVCRQLHAACRSADVTLVDVLGRSPGELKYLIAHALLCVSGRFHGMIAALASGVPVVVTGWSHKYREVLADFDQADAALSVDALSADLLSARIERAVAEEDTIRSALRAALPAVVESARRNFDWFAADAQATLRRLRDR